MDVNTLNITVKQLAVSNGLCQQWQDEWREDEDNDSLMKKFLRGIDFYISTRFISKRQCLLWFSQEDRHRHNIVIDERRSVLNPRCGIAIGNSHTTVRCNARHVCSFYAVDNSKLNIIVNGNSHIRITLCDNAEIQSLDIAPDANVYICRAGVNTKIVDYIGTNIKITENYQLYEK